jgi:hypothetical protein
MNFTRTEVLNMLIVHIPICKVLLNLLLCFSKRLGQGKPSFAALMCSSHFLMARLCVDLSLALIMSITGLLEHFRVRVYVWPRVLMLMRWYFKLFQLEEFRQKRQQKGGSNKSSSTAVKPLAEDKSLPGISVAPVSSATQQDIEPLQRADVQDGNVTGTLELEVEAPQQLRFSPDENGVPGDVEAETLLPTERKNVMPAQSGASEDVTSGEFRASPESVSGLGFPAESHGGVLDNKGEEAFLRKTESKISVDVGSGRFAGGELSSNGLTSENGQDIAFLSSSNIQV